MAFDLLAGTAGFASGLAGGLRKNQEAAEEKRRFELLREERKGARAEGVRQFDLLLDERKEDRSLRERQFKSELDGRKSKLLLNSLVPVMARFNKSIRLARASGQPELIDLELLDKTSLGLSKDIKRLFSTDRTEKELGERIFSIMLQKDQSVSQFLKQVEGSPLGGNARIALETLFSQPTGEAAQKTFRQFGLDMLDVMAGQGDQPLPRDISRVPFGRFLTPDDIADAKARGLLDPEFVVPGLALAGKLAEAKRAPQKTLAQIEAEAAAKKKGTLSETPLESSVFDEEGNVKPSVRNAMDRQIILFFKGKVDQSGNISFLDPSLAPRHAASLARAEKLLSIEGLVDSPSEATQVSLAIDAVTETQKLMAAAKAKPLTRKLLESAESAKARHAKEIEAEVSKIKTAGTERLKALGVSKAQLKKAIQGL